MADLTMAAVEAVVGRRVDAGGRLSSYECRGASLYRWGDGEMARYLAAPTPRALSAIQSTWPHGNDFLSVRPPLFEHRRGRWITFEFGHPYDLPETEACYAVLVDGMVAYVGQTRNLRARFSSHGFYLVARLDEPPMWITPWGAAGATRLQFKRRVLSRYGERYMAEARLIRKLNPPLNRARP